VSFFLTCPLALATISPGDRIGVKRNVRRNGDICQEADMFVLNASRHKWIELPLEAIFLMLLLATQALAGAEEVYVAKIMTNDDNAIIVRGNGEAYLIEKGVGCLSLWRYEGKRVLIVSPGLFLGVGSKLLIPEAGQECRIWDSKSLGTWSSSAPQRLPPPRATSTAQAIQQVQLALSLLGYSPGPRPGVLDDKTLAALRSFQQEKNLVPVGTLSAQTYLALATAVYQARPNDPQALQLAMNLLKFAEASRPGLGGSGRSGCEDGHWISSVSSGGEIVILEDGSVWQVDSIDRIVTALWLPTENVIICGNTMINTDNGEKVGVTQLR
jgi:hypothetical protein